MKKVIVMLAVLAIAAPVMAFHPTDRCSSCHVPHNAVTLAGMPLWAGSETPFVADIIPYTSYTLQSGAAATTNSDLSGSTIVCLSCHDNSTRNSHPINTKTDVMGNTVVEVAGNLAETHPIEMVYDNALFIADNELNDPAGVPLGMVKHRGSIEATLLEGPTPGAKRVTCISCHEVHINGLHEFTTDSLAGGSYDTQGTGNSKAPGFIADGDGYMLDATGDKLAWLDTYDNATGLPTETGGVPDGVGDGIADLFGTGGNFNLAGEPVPYEVLITVGPGTETTEYDFDFPHLVDVTGIRWEASSRSNPADPEAYRLYWGALCRVCHIK